MYLSRAVPIAILALASCGDDLVPSAGEPGGDAADAAPAPDAGDQAVAIAFAARVGDAPFACGSTYDGVGSAGSAYVGRDFRFYVHDVELRRAGTDDYVALTLDQDGFQQDGLALLDFEDATGACQSGTAATHAAITGTIPPGDYSGVRFTVGVPVELNHIDPEAAPAPLDQSGMLWAWQGGFKFVRIDGSVDGAGFNLHLGSTGCPGDVPDAPPTGPCVNPNRPTVELAFDPARDTIVADVADVLATVDVSQNTAETAPGCMSFPGDPECARIFPRLGLGYGEAAAGAQRLFRVE